jgi:hypothetical protein
MAGPLALRRTWRKPRTPQRAKVAAVDLMADDLVPDDLAPVPTDTQGNSRHKAPSTPLND